MGDRRAAKLLGEATVANVGGTSERGQYEVALSETLPIAAAATGVAIGDRFGRPPEDAADPEFGDAGVWRRGEVKRYPRKDLAVWHLIGRAIQAACKSDAKSDDVDRNAWGTPEYILDVVREGFGGTIDVDPASNTTAQERVRADVWYGEGSPFGADGTAVLWGGNVFLNPPYGKGLLLPFAETLRDSVQANTCTGHAVLVNLDPSTDWFRLIESQSTAICLLDKRVGFLHPVTGKPISGNPRPQCLLLRGVNLEPYRRIGRVQAR